MVSLTHVEVFPETLKPHRTQTQGGDVTGRVCQSEHQPSVDSISASLLGASAEILIFNIMLTSTHKQV